MHAPFVYSIFRYNSRSKRKSSCIWSYTLSPTALCTSYIHRWRWTTAFVTVGMLSFDSYPNILAGKALVVEHAERRAWHYIKETHFDIILPQARNKAKGYRTILDCMVLLSAPERHRQQFCRNENVVKSSLVVSLVTCLIPLVADFQPPVQDLRRDVRVVLFQGWSACRYMCSEWHCSLACDVGHVR